MTQLPVSSRAAKTPAQRVIELKQKIAAQDERIAALRGQVREHELAAERWTSLRGMSFGGRSMAQIATDLLLWEKILNSTPGLKGIVEIGTWHGGFSGWLWAQTRIRGIGFFTCDSVAPPLDGMPWRDCFERVDVFADKQRITDVVLEMGGPVIIFCDGGNKPRELLTYETLLGRGSLIAAHDWKTETMPSDVPDTLEEVYGDLCDETGSMTRWFRARA